MIDCLYPGHVLQAEHHKCKELRQESQGDWGEGAQRVGRPAVEKKTRSLEITEASTFCSKFDGESQQADSSRAIFNFKADILF